MNHGSLFSGIGGFDLAAEWMGWNNVLQVEWDDWCQKILTKNFPDVPKFRDIVEFNKMLKNGEIITDTDREFWGKRGESESSVKPRHGKSIQRCVPESRQILQKPDIITGGFPCQPFSHAGKRGGQSDERYLWPEMLTTIRTLKPTYVVGENVAGLISMEGGKTLDTILTDLEDEGYTVESFVIPACAVGAWHRRDRIWIVAYRKGVRTGGLRNEGEEEGTRNSNELSGECSSKSSIRQDVPDSNNQGLQGRKESRNTEGIGKERDEQSERYCELFGGQYWQFEPDVGRVANGIPNRVDRLKGLGNAIVPQVAYEIFKAIEQLNKTT